MFSIVWGFVHTCEWDISETPFIIIQSYYVSETTTDCKKNEQMDTLSFVTTYNSLSQMFFYNPPSQCKCHYVFITFAASTGEIQQNLHKKSKFIFFITGLHCNYK